MDRPSHAFLGPEPFAPAFARAAVADVPEVWDALCTEIGPDVLVLPLFTPDACARLLDEVDRRAAEHPAATPPNSMHGFGAILGDLGLGGFLRDLHDKWLRPLAEWHFAPYGADAIDDVHGFLAEYGPEHDADLGFHVDDSAYTLNVCLTGDFRGSELYFGGPRCDLHQQTGERPGEAFAFEHELGTAVLHAGRHRHGVHPILEGRRRNLIVWFQSSAGREAARTCPTWCGEHR